MSVGPTADNYGRTFVDNVAFRHFYPGLKFARTSWEASFSGAKPSGWWIHHTHMMTGGARGSPAYSKLLELIDDKDYFVLTSNVDGLFSRSGFDHARIYTPQGDFRVRQCAQPCSSSATWLGRPDVERLLPHLDEQTMELRLRPPVAWTACHRCGKAPQRPNLRGGSFFVHRPYQAQQDRLMRFIEESTGSGKKLVVLEIGCGFNTPVVTRMPAEGIALEFGAPLIRINLMDAAVPEELPAAVGLSLDTTEALARLIVMKGEDNGRRAWPQKSAARCNEGEVRDWRGLLRNLQDPTRQEMSVALAEWSGLELTAAVIAADGMVQ